MTALDPAYDVAITHKVIARPELSLGERTLSVHDLDDNHVVTTYLAEDDILDGDLARAGYQRVGGWDDTGKVHRCFARELPAEVANVTRLRGAYEAHRRTTKAARDELRSATLALIDDGMSEARAAEYAGVDRMTVRSWRGKKR